MVSDETNQRITGPHDRCFVLKWYPKKEAYIVYDSEAKSTRAAKGKHLKLVTASTTELVPDLIADQLSFELISLYMLAGSTLLWNESNWAASKVMFMQTRRFILDEELRRAVGSFAGNMIHTAWYCC